MAFPFANFIFLFVFRLPFRDPVLVFCLVLFIILLAPIVLRKLRIPSIVGLILAGVAIGQYGFNLMQGDLLQKGTPVNLFGTVGLLYIMFMAALELDLNEFKRNQPRSLLFGILTFSFPFLIGWVVCEMLLHFSITTSILVSSMFSTHTLVAYPIASRLGITKNQAVTIAVGGTLVTDTAVLLILAVITGSVSGTLDMLFWIRLGISLIVFIAMVFILFPIIGRWFFKNIKADSVSQYIFVLAMVFFAGFLAEFAGMDAIIGAFMAGLALNRLIPNSSALMNRLEFVGNALFIPFFLIGVGMLVDLHVLLKGPQALVVAFTLTAVAFGGKYIAAFITQKIFHQTKLQRHVLFGLTSAHAAATLAVILVGYKIGLVNEAILNGTVILILITCLLSSFITENAGRKLAIIDNEQLPPAEENHEKILVPISNPQTIGYLMDFATMLYDKKYQQPIYALSIVTDNDEAREKIRVSNKMMEKVLVHASATESEVKIITRVDLNAVSGITRAATELAATNIVIGWSRRATAADRFFNRLFGTTLNNIIQQMWQTVFFCHFIHPLNTSRKIIMMVSQNAEYELGFSLWANKIMKLSSEAGAGIYLYSGEKTFDAFKREMEKIKSSLQINFTHFENIENFFLLSRDLTKNDLLIIVGARKGTLSYHNYHDNLPDKLNRHFKDFNFMLLYPEQQQVSVHDDTGVTEKDLTLSPIQEQIQNITRIGKAVKKIFTEKKKE